ncbi:hypothetical protein [Reinekea marinisedimentorum]|uniref:Uncharacterized protein n=1 Tax=Reinekea marinisedimentorum TaxID=230495 RepID=A0A4R3HRW9_9GAMM|nr:hypothetical protein [Reinekea marinisedimentorum]TCS35668.1 hypothetical protein BCF53_1345 [Reinekea marinisedimentorum]
MNGIEMSLIGSGNIIAMIGHQMMLTKNGSQPKEQLKIVAELTRETGWGLVILAAFLVSRFAFNLDYLAYLFASLLVLFPLYEISRRKQSIFSSKLFFKGYYFGAVSLKQIGFSLLFFGIALWTLKLTATF